MIEFQYIPLSSYHQTLLLMHELHKKVSEKQAPSTIIFTEHLPVVTMGKRNLIHDMLVSEKYLASLNIEFAHIDRGGSVTVHEPGQLVCYPIVRLHSSKAVRPFIHLLEETMIQICLQYNIKAQRDIINPGIYVGTNKIGALGVRIHHSTTKHGFALNLNNSLNTFQYVIPCGLQERGVTSLKKETSLNLSIEETIKFSKEYLKEHLPPFLQN